MVTREVAITTTDGPIDWSGVAMEAIDEPGMVPFQGE
jgi:hypothetical protein